MHKIMYIDESGDNNMDLSIQNACEYFALTGLIIDVSSWNSNYNIYKDMKRRLKDVYGLKIRDEIHASALLNKKKEYKYMHLNNAIITKIFADTINTIILMSDIKLLNIYINKNDLNAQKSISYFHDNVEELAWNRVTTRFNKYLETIGEIDEKQFGLVIPDKSREKQIQLWLRKWRIYNLQVIVGNPTNYPLINIIEDPLFKDSRNSPFLQLADMICYSLVMRERFNYKGPGKNMYKRVNGQFLFDKLNTFFIKGASKDDPDGIVRF